MTCDLHAADGFKCGALMKTAVVGQRTLGIEGIARRRILRVGYLALYLALYGALDLPVACILGTAPSSMRLDADVQSPPIEIRWRCPPENWCGCFGRSNRLRPTDFRKLLTLALGSSLSLMMP